MRKRAVTRSPAKARSTKKPWPDPRHATTKSRARTKPDTIVYLGPSLPADDARRLLPGAEIRGPAAVGDILRASRERGIRRIAIIDGYFERMAAVWHKEILVALERGIEVWGASSMGALRAAELAPFGMRGVGEVYEQLAHGELESDDEVAVAHLPAAQGYRAVSVALVSIRVALAVAAHTGAIREKTRAALVEIARGMFYRDRTWEALLAEGRRRGGPAAALAAAAAWPKHDIKAMDAQRLLLALAGSRPVKPRRIRVPRTWALRQLETLVL